MDTDGQRLFALELTRDAVGLLTRPAPWKSAPGRSSALIPLLVLHPDRLLNSSEDDVVPWRVGGDHIVADADRQDVLAVELLPRHFDRGDPHPRLPALERVDHVHPRKLLEDSVVLLVPQEVEERPELRPKWQLTLREVRGTDGAEDLPDGRLDERLSPGSGEVGLLISPKRPQDADP